MNAMKARMREFANHLIADETKGNSSNPKTPAALLVCERLRPHLATLMGKSGFRAILARALALTNAEVAGLRSVHVNAEGSLEGFQTPAASSEIAEGTVVLITHLLELLVAFIGESLTVRLVSEVWPHLPLEDPFAVPKGPNEKAE